MKVTLEDEIKNVRFMEHAAGMNHLCSKGLSYADICDLAETQYKEAKGVGKWPPSAHTSSSHMHHLPRTSPNWNKIWPFLHEEIAISHGQCKQHGFQFLPQEQLWQKSPIINSLL